MTIAAPGQDRTIDRKARTRRGGPVNSLRRHGSALPKAVVFVILFAFFAIPSFVLLSSAFTKNATGTWTAPTRPVTGNFSYVATMPGFVQSLLNGAILSVGSAILGIALGALAAYPLSRFRFRGRIGYLLAILFVSGLPVTAMIVPIYEFFLSFNWLDSLVSTTLIMGAFAAPVSIWMMKTFLDNVDPALEEAAWVDGANRLTAYVRVVLPIMSSGILVVFLLNFVTGWANFYVPFILLSTQQKLPIAVTIYTFFGSNGTVEYGRLAAFSIFYSLPAVILYVFTGGRFGAAFSAGAFK